MSSLPEVVAAYLLIMMLAVGVLLLVCGAAGLLHRGIVAVRARRCLHRDWLFRFERDLHDYAGKTWSSARERELQD